MLMTRRVLRRLRRVAWAKPVVLALALFVALAPVAQAFCLIDLDAPAGKGSPPTVGTDHHAASHGSDHAPDPCCEHGTSLFAAPTDQSDDLAAGAARVGEPVARPAGMKIAPVRAIADAAVHPDSSPPPDRLFRRFKRLLI